MGQILPPPKPRRPEALGPDAQGYMAIVLGRPDGHPAGAITPGTLPDAHQSRIIVGIDAHPRARAVAAKSSFADHPAQRCGVAIKKNISLPELLIIIRVVSHEPVG